MVTDRRIRRQVATMSVGARTTRRPNNQTSTSHYSQAFIDDWEQFVTDVQTEIQQSINKGSVGRLTPYEKPISVLKRLAYGFVRSYRKNVGGKYIESAIENYRLELERGKHRKYQRNYRLIQSKFDEKPFYWVLVGLQSALEFSEIQLGGHDLTRFSQQLTYADAHDVPPECLIGFLYQSGTIAEVCKKAKTPGCREPWYKGTANAK